MSIATENLGAEAQSGQETPDFGKDIQGLKDSLAQLKTDVTGLLGAAVDAGKNVAQAARDKAGNVVDGVQQRVGGLKQQGSDCAEKIEQKIADRPLASALILFGVGFLAATLLSRK